MLNSFINSYAPQNASIEAKKTAKSIIASNEEYGVINKMLELVPTLSEEVKKLSDSNNVIDQIINDGLNNDSFDSDSMNSIITSLTTAYDWGLIDQEYLADILYRYYDQVQTPIAVNNEQYNQTVELLNKLNMVEFDQSRVLNKMVVSG